MYTEIKEAVNFLAKYLLGKIPRRSVSLFTQELANYLVCAYVDMWDTNEPKTKERERMIRIRCGNRLSDQLINKAALAVGLEVDEVNFYLPENIHLYVNPGEVYYKCSERSLPCPIWMGAVNADDDYQCLPASALQPHEQESSPSNMGAAGKTVYIGQPANTDNVDDPFVPLQLDTVYSSIDSPIKNHNGLKQFTFVPKDHKIYIVQDFAITRFGCNRNRPDHDVLRNIQQQAAMKACEPSYHNMSDKMGRFPNSLTQTPPPNVPQAMPPYQQHQPDLNTMGDILASLPVHDRQMLIARLLDIQRQEQRPAARQPAPPTAFATNLFGTPPRAMCPNNNPTIRRRPNLAPGSGAGDMGHFNSMYDMRGSLGSDRMK